MMKEINGVWFEVVDKKKAPKKHSDLCEKASHYDGKYLEQIYDRCSQVKYNIYNEWCDFVVEINPDGKLYGFNTKDSAFSICSHNNNQFTLSFIVKKYGVFYITKCHNYLLVD